MELLISIVVGLALMELYAWVPALCQWLVGRAASQVPTEYEHRCREEWEASLEALPNTVVRLAHALSYCWAARRIAADFWAETFNEVDNALVSVCEMQGDLKSLQAELLARSQQLISKAEGDERELCASTQRLRADLERITNLLTGVPPTKLPPAIAQDVLGFLVQARRSIP
jgi:hypothetical protein